MTSVRQSVSGRPATVSYLAFDFEPATADDFAYAKVQFDDGDMAFLRADDDQREAAAFNRHRGRKAIQPSTAEGNDEANAWGRHRGRPFLVVIAAPEHAVAHQLEAWAKAVMILDASEIMIRDLIETRLAGVPAILRAGRVRVAHRVVGSLMGDIAAVRTTAVKIAFRALRDQVGDRKILAASLSQWAAAFLRDDLRNIGQAIQMGIAEGLDSIEIARKIVGSLASNGVDGVTQFTRAKITQLSHAAIKESKRRRKGG